MSLDELNTAVASTGGGWFTLHKKEHGTLEGTVISFEKRDRTNPKGDIVYKNGTQNPRKVWTFTLKLDETSPLIEGPDDDGLRKFDANESAQMAIARAIREAKVTAKEGDRLKIKVKEEAAEGDYKQAEYVAVWTAGAAPLAIDTPDDEGEDW